MTYVKSKLQNHLESYMDRKGEPTSLASSPPPWRIETSSVTTSSTATPLAGRKPAQVPALQNMPGQDKPNVELPHKDKPMLPLNNMPAKCLRRRYTQGDLVRVYKGADEGFVQAKVVAEKVDGKPAIEDVGARDAADPLF